MQYIISYPLFVLATCGTEETLWIPYDELKAKTMADNVVRLAKAFRNKDGDFPGPIEDYLPLARSFMYGKRTSSTKRKDIQPQGGEFNDEPIYVLDEAEDSSADDDVHYDLHNSPSHVIYR